MSPRNKMGAEALGTFWLVFGGCSRAALAASFPQYDIGFVGVSLAFGLSVLTMAYAVSHISGGHFNPAATVGLCVGGRFPAFPIGLLRLSVHWLRLVCYTLLLAAKQASIFQVGLPPMDTASVLLVAILWLPD